MSIWSWMAREFKERVMKFETVQGLYLLPCGVIGLVIVWTHTQYILHAMGSTYFGYLILCGAWKIFYSPVKQKMRRDEMLRDREAVNAVGDN